MAILAEGGVSALTPKSVGEDRDDVVGWSRAWLALVASDSSSDRVGGVHALVEGLRLALCADEPTLDPDQAVRLLVGATPLFPLA